MQALRCWVAIGTIYKTYRPASLTDAEVYHAQAEPAKQPYSRALCSSDNAALRRDRVVGPILQLKDELFQTFRQRRSIVSVQEYETDKASLQRMLADFESDFAKSGQVGYQDSCRPCSHFSMST